MDTHFQTKGLLSNRHKLTTNYYNLRYFRGNIPGSICPHDYLRETSFIDGKFRDILKFLSRHLVPGRILDVGCGPAYLQKAARKFHFPFEVWGCDIAVDVIKRAKNLGATHLRIADMTKLPYPDYFFDAVTLIDVIEHVTPEEAHEGVIEGYRVLKSRGVIFIRTPNRVTWTRKYWKDKGHLWLASAEELRQLFLLAGFTEESIQITTRGFPGSRLFIKIFGRDLLLPKFGSVLLGIARKP